MDCFELSRYERIYGSPSYIKCNFDILKRMRKHSINFTHIDNKTEKAVFEQ